MTHLAASARLKVKQDTYFLPDPNGGAYFRNNSGSFRIKGASIYQWIEKLLPMFNGEHTMEDLTNGLPAPYRNRVYEIGNMLHKNGFVRDVSSDRTHQLKSSVLETYAAQIEFIENFGDSGAYRFQLCRQTKVLAAGSGSFLVSLVRSLTESGFSNIRVMAGGSSQSALEELTEIAGEEAVELTDAQNWREAVRSVDWVLYVSEDGLQEELLKLQTICMEEKKGFIPGVCLKQIGLAGPIVQQDGDACWKSAWRRIHQAALHEDRELAVFSSAGKDMLANTIVFDLFKTVTGLTPLTKRNQFFLIDLATLEGAWYPFLKHPLIDSDGTRAQLIDDLEGRMAECSDNKEEGRLFQFFNELTSDTSGIFHLWEEKHLKQLPLSQCFVQAADPLSKGPAKLLPESVCIGFTHEEARREAGLTGIEMYVSRLARSSINHGEDFGIGAGETIAEGVLRGLQKCLEHRLTERKKGEKETIVQFPLGVIQDKQSAFYFKALTMMHGRPEIGLSKDIEDFPVVWAGIHGRWYGSPGLNLTLALRKALERALMGIKPLEKTDMILQKNDMKLDIPVCEDSPQTLLSTLINNHSSQFLVYDFPAEPFLKENLAGIYGVQLRKEEA
ncbi:putative thiazole-containing bacteriocin maturation protein [Bacillus swezeyi]|uniref:Thiazole-containing bacteriocin maturation protein n=1 Tax=Bacillus swezeyi TaxID=1925020 RepID=A0A1R1RW28_9BACI|nr:putative thiazole-containing bacteriocin maturation protein [Bacillus swezeyi]MEC1261731.1 putative thiazole-containing bacteriocin maturation protein [Bacillus swezeyi]MED2926406.1 putative thiazole-containing bacteriocin maturation protein [Bacillus swezeyi]MED2966031.1 putative thiazole-containing bacteriocin maturation protein [Bacillus swezeyi]MED3070565.1 putative thiazole-containing bacteriocin maturation protein [Bacillus swezeyi]MED3082225.1 putative thiazole-containing bacteriocin